MIHALRAFRYRNFRLYFCGQSLSLLGTWVQQVAMSWLVYRMTGSLPISASPRSPARSPSCSSRRWGACGRTVSTAASC